MTFEEDFPSLKGVAVTLISGPESDATLLKIGGKEFNHELLQSRGRDYDLAIPLSAIESSCLDKQKVREITDYIIKIIEQVLNHGGDTLIIPMPEMMKIRKEIKELGL